MSAYDKPPELYDGLRLHQNENTGGCSPRVLEALARLRPDEVSFYPPYTSATRTCAAYLGVDPALVALTNGLDEGIMGIAVAYLRSRPGSPFPPARCARSRPCPSSLRRRGRSAGGWSRDPATSGHARSPGSRAR